MQTYNDVTAILASNGKHYGGVILNPVKVKGLKLKGELLFDELGRFPNNSQIITSRVVNEHFIEEETYVETLNTVYKIKHGEKT